jgi:hypothetical protein
MNPYATVTAEASVVSFSLLRTTSCLHSLLRIVFFPSTNFNANSCCGCCAGVQVKQLKNIDAATLQQSGLSFGVDGEVLEA